MNILILSCGTRNLLVRYFRESQNGFTRVIGTDCSKYAPALYETDAHYIVPPMNTDGYLDTILDICHKEDIRVILPLQEDELALIASNKKLFTDQGILPMISDSRTIELCRDKYAMFLHLREHGLPAVDTYRGFPDFQSALNDGRISFPVFVKPNRGCGSIGIQKVGTPDLLEVLCKYSEDPIIQPFVAGEEFGADIYVDAVTDNATSIFIKKKLRMRAGETEKAISVKDDGLFDLIRKVITTLPFCGPVDMDIFKINDQYYISEINPRFGGGYPHAYKCGISFPRMISNNASGIANANQIGQYKADVCMLKYTDLITF